MWRKAVSSNPNSATISISSKESESNQKLEEFYIWLA
jgi:hypothetical protein